RRQLHRSWPLMVEIQGCPLQRWQQGGSLTTSPPDQLQVELARANQTLALALTEPHAARAVAALHAARGPPPKRGPGTRRDRLVAAGPASYGPSVGLRKLSRPAEAHHRHVRAGHMNLAAGGGALFAIGDVGDGTGSLDAQVELGRVRDCAHRILPMQETQP